jgi:hypothetical protein
VKRERLRANIDEFPPEVRVYEEPILRLIRGVSDVRNFAREDSNGEKTRKSEKERKSQRKWCLIRRNTQVGGFGGDWC